MKTAATVMLLSVMFTFSHSTHLPQTGCAKKFLSQTSVDSNSASAGLKNVVTLAMSRNGQVAEDAKFYE